MTDFRHLFQHLFLSVLPYDCLPFIFLNAVDNSGGTSVYVWIVAGARDVYLCVFVCVCACVCVCVVLVLLLSLSPVSQVRLLLTLLQHLSVL